MSTQWFYTHEGKSTGPVTPDELKKLVATGQLSPSALLWKAGMADWLPAGKISGLFGAEPTPVASAAPAVAVPQGFATAVGVSSPTDGSSQIGYFSNSSGLPARTAITLKGYASAIGDRGDWPLDDQQLIQLREAEKFRKKIRNAAGLYRGLFALCLIAAICFIIAGAFSMASPRGGSAIYGIGVALAISGGLAVLYYFASTATKKCHRWASLTLFILFMLSIVLQVGTIVMSASVGGPAFFATLLSAVLGMILPAAFAYSSWQAYSSIPKFLACPMWCQEALVNAKL